MSGHSELIRDRIILRREQLAEHNPEAIDVAAVMLAAMHDAAYRHVPEIRCDRLVRHRSYQLEGEKALQVEDLVAIALENPRGHAVVLAGLRVLMTRLGYAVAPAETEAPPMTLLDAASKLIEQASPLLTVAVKGQTLDAEALQPRIDQLKAAVIAIEQVGQRGRAGER